MIALSLLLLAAAQTTAPEPVPATAPPSAAQEQGIDCTAPQGQMEMNICAGEEFRRADSELNKQWDAAAFVMRQRDMMMDKSYDNRPSFYAQLLAAQRAWIIYRDEHCAMEGYYARGGSLESYLVAQCLTELTKQRIIQLHNQEIWPE